MLDMIFRTFVIFAALLLLMRLLGKRQFGELELSELVVSILIADVASVPLQNPDLPLEYGLVPCVVLFACEYGLSWLTMKNTAARKLAFGKASFLVVDGKIEQKMMRHCHLSMDELMCELRKQGVNDIAQVRYAVLETDGTLNVILRPEQRPVTAGQLGVAEEDDGYAVILVEDGALLKQNLTAAGVDLRWLRHELARRGCESVEQVYALIVYGSGKVYFAKKD